ncbi:hypothetical protein KC19_9G010800, partial [Ceratodon purpureus]
MDRHLDGAQSRPTATLHVAGALLTQQTAKQIPSHRSKRTEWISSCQRNPSLAPPDSNDLFSRDPRTLALSCNSAAREGYGLDFPTSTHLLRDCVGTASGL